jgi:hypothetical protein
MSYSTKVLLVYVALMVALLYCTASYMGPKIRASNEKWEADCKAKHGLTYRTPKGDWLCVKPHSIIKMD